MVISDAPVARASSATVARFCCTSSSTTNLCLSITFMCLLLAQMGAEGRQDVRFEHSNC